ncbi:MAG: AAA family ATPase [Actinomycetota bacterium]
MTANRRPEVSLYRRNTAHITARRLLHPLEKQEAIEALPFRKRKKAEDALRAEWATEEGTAAEESRSLMAELRTTTDAMDAALQRLVELAIPELLGKVEAQQARVAAARSGIDSAFEALDKGDFGAAGLAADGAKRDLWLIGGPMVVALNQALSQAAIGKVARQRLAENGVARREAKVALTQSSSREDAPSVISAVAEVHRLEAEGFDIAADILSAQRRDKDTAHVAKVGREGGLRVVQPQELETFDDVGGLEDVKEQLRNTVGAILERPDEAAKYRVVHNGILFHGPPGTGKTLLSRALAGEYGMRYIRFSPASIASAYIHEAAQNLQRLFEVARENVPCVLFLDEVDVIAGARDDQPSADHREVVTQLMNSLEEYRSVPGLVIAAATNNIDRLDPGLREGRFDAKILVSLPDPEARANVIKVHLERRSDAVDWSDIDLEEIGRLTAGRNAAALEGFVSLAAQSALRTGGAITHEILIDAIKQREGKDRLSLDQPVSWEDVVLDDDTQEQITEILHVFSRPDLARSLGVKPPAGILLHGPPGTGKTTIAKAMATEIKASFYEQSAADLLSKWAGESEERVAKLFTKARANRPSIVFIDEIDSLLRRRQSDSATPWEERVVSQFLRELDGLGGGDGVLLVGATNRLDIIDPAIQGRRLSPIEVGLPNARGRLRLLEVLCRDVSLAEDVDLSELARATEGLSGADIKRLRDQAGMKALTRAARMDSPHEEVAISQADLYAALESQRQKASLVQI